MNLDIIARLVQILRDAPELGAIEVRRGLFGTWSSVRVSRAGHSPNAGGGHIVVSQASSPAPLSPPTLKLLEIKSPMVGTFYAAPEPGAQPYVRMGSRVAAGDVVCIIEAMKIMNEIESEVTGVVREVSVENAQPVEFGQVLFKVDPHG
jgi:acetyl-CoA carboxylase biotin carboxyl carrier protein